MSFGKLYEQTFTGSMMGAGPVVFSVWSYVVAHVKPPGRLEINPRLVAALIGTTAAEVQKALDVLTAPDPESRSKEQEGRRLIREGEFTYRVPTFARYRNGTEEEQRKANAARQARFREKHKAQPKPNGKRKPVGKPLQIRVEAPPLAQVEEDRPQNGTDPTREEA